MDEKIEHLAAGKKYLTSIQITFLILFVSPVKVYAAEGGKLYDAWLQYVPVEAEGLRISYEKILQHIVVQGRNATVRTAAEELGRALEKMLGRRIRIDSTLEMEGNILLGTPETSSLIAGMQSVLNLKRVGEEGFVIKTTPYGSKPVLVVGANSPAGVIYGTFALIRRLQLRQSVENLALAESPHIPLRLVNHWDSFGGFTGDSGKHFKTESIFNWEGLESGEICRIRDWARLLTSVGINAICPTNVNWHWENNFIEHLDEVKIMADLFRNYGIKLFWSPTHSIAIKPSAAKALYKYVPDFGGYYLKFGSEGQPGDPGPQTINSVARILAPYGGQVIIRAFVYGKYFGITYYEEPDRMKVPYQFFTPKDGQYDENVVVSAKYTPADFQIREPINPLDGVLKKTAYGTEFQISQEYCGRDWYPMSWLQIWKRWLDFDNFRDGRGSLNRNCIKSIVGVAGVGIDPDRPNPWGPSLLSMVNYYGFGRLAWKPELSAEEIHREWIGMTFSLDENVQTTVNKILLLSDDAIEHVSNYRGMWFMDGDNVNPASGKGRVPQQITEKGLGANRIETGLTSLYSPEVQSFYEDPLRNEDLLCAFRFVPYDYKLTNGKTVIQDIYAVHNQGVDEVDTMRSWWKTLEGKIDEEKYRIVLAEFDRAVEAVARWCNNCNKYFQRITGILPE